MTLGSGEDCGHEWADGVDCQIWGRWPFRCVSRTHTRRRWHNVLRYGRYETRARYQLLTVQTDRLTEVSTTFASYARTGWACFFGVVVERLGVVDHVAQPLPIEDVLLADSVSLTARLYSCGESTAERKCN